MSELAGPGENTEEIELLIALHKEAAIGNTAAGRLDTAVAHLTEALAQTNGNLLDRARILIERAEVNESREWYWKAYQDYRTALSLVRSDTPLVEASAALEATLVNDMERIITILEGLASQWPMPYDYSSDPYMLEHYALYDRLRSQY